MVSQQTSSIQSLDIEVPEGEILPYCTLLQAGFSIEVSPDQTVEQILLTLAGFTKHYIHQRIETIFLNGLPLDSFSAIVTEDKAVIALSAAMPGLAGAIFKKGSIHASLRTQTLSKDSSPTPASGPIHISLKLFNMVARERGPELLEKGCLLSGGAITKFLQDRDILLDKAISICFAGNKVTKTELKEKLLEAQVINISVRSTH